MDQHISSLERKLDKYQEQQSLYDLLKSDLRAYKELSKLSQEKAINYFAFKPLNKYSKETLQTLPQIVNSINIYIYIYRKRM